MKFRLSKWYLDCVSDDGQLFIGYTAALSLGPVPLNLVSRVTLIDGTVHQVTAGTWTDQAPADTGAELTWSCRKLDLRGTWKSRQPAFSRTLFESNQGHVIWRCRHPLSDAEVRLGGRTLHGLGYVEKLVMDIEPVDLGLTTLYWGRFLTSDTSLVWIKWTGQESRLTVFHNGAEVTDVSLSKDGLAFGSDQRLHWTDSVPIRTGQIGSSVLKTVPLLKQALPAWVSGISESKWRSRGILESTTHNPAIGWVIHEEVGFEHRDRKG
jgi:hypothetical protein